MPDGPRAPAAITTMALQADPTGVLRRASNRYGETFSLNMLPLGRVVVTSSPALVEQMITGAPEAFRAGAATQCLLPVLGDRSLIVRDGQDHRTRRRAMLPAFSPQGLERWKPAIERLVAGHVERWPRGRPFDALPRARELAYDAIASVVGVTGTGLECEIARRLGRIAAPPVGPSVFLPSLRRTWGGAGPWAVFRRRVRAIDALIAEAIGRTGDSGDRPSVAAHLLDLRRRGAIASDAEVVEEIRTLLLVGHETATAAIAWLLLTIAWQPRAVDEVDDDHAVDAVVQESLRLHPPVFDVVRELGEPLEAARCRIPAGTVLLAAPSLVHQRADLYDEPREFRPRRFTQTRPDPFMWIPFGGGIRRCLGAALAQLELAAVVRAVAAAGRLTPGRPQLERARLNGTTLVPSGGCHVALESKRVKPVAG